MNRLRAWIKTVIVGHRVPLTDEQLTGDACTLCGHRFFDSEYRASYGWIGLPFLGRRAWACQTACTITAVDDVEDLFRSAIPARQDIQFWHLGTDDVPLVTDDYGFDQVDATYVASIATQPHVRVEIIHAGGVLTTRPLPEQYAGHIAVRAQKLGFTAMLADQYADPEQRAAAARDAIDAFQAWGRIDRALGGNTAQVPSLPEVIHITNETHPGIDLTAEEAQAAINQAYARLESDPFTLAQQVVTPDGPGTVTGINTKVAKVMLTDGRTRNYPVTFVQPRNEDER
jgi:hypothetical protein